MPTFESIRLSEPEIKDLFAKLSATDVEPDGDVVRFDCKKAFAVLVVKFDDEARKFMVPVRNISKRGMSVLHRSMIHEGTRGFIVLPTKSNKAEPHKIVIGKSRHATGMIYELNLRFREEIDPENIAFQMTSKAAEQAN